MEADIGDNSSSPRELALRLGRFNVAWCMGFVIGWPLAGVVGQACGQRWRSSRARCWLCSASWFCWGAPSSRRGSRGNPDPESERRAAGRAVPFWVMALVLNFAAMGLSNAVRSLMPAVTGGGRSMLGGAYGAIFFGGQVAVSVLLAVWTRWHFRAGRSSAGRRGHLRRGLCGFWDSAPAFALGCLLGGLGCGVVYFSSIYYSIAAATGKGHRGGIHEAVLGAGGGVVPLLGGMLANTGWAEARFAWKAGVPFLAAAGFLALAVLVALPIYVRARRCPGPPREAGGNLSS